MTLLSVAQMNSQNEIEQNFMTIESLIQQSKAKGAELIAFPENFVCFAAGKQRETAAQFESIQQRLEQLAHQYQIWIIAGTLPCPYRPDGSIIEDGRVRTVSLCISPEKLKPAMTRFTSLMYRSVMLLGAIRNPNSLNQVPMSSLRRRLLAILA